MDHQLYLERWRTSPYANAVPRCVFGLYKGEYYIVSNDANPVGIYHFVSRRKKSYVVAYNRCAPIIIRYGEMEFNCWEVQDEGALHGISCDKGPVGQVDIFVANKILPIIFPQ